jgi:uncharacterized phage protein (TIGR02218 family)
MADPSRVWFHEALETVAIWWRIARVDGVTLGFVNHDRDIAFDGVVHRSAPGMTPAAIRRTATLEADSAEVAAAFDHDTIREEDLSSGRFDGAAVSVGLIDWENLERHVLYNGTIGAVGIEGNGFSAELQSIKSSLDRELVPRTSPTCRAEFCEEGCTLSAAAYTSVATIIEVRAAGWEVRLDAIAPNDLLGFGQMRLLQGQDAGLWRRIEAANDGWLSLDRAVAPDLASGTKVLVREGCDHTLATCRDRFGNALNFQGEPFLPGNDLLVRYPLASA